MENIFCEWILEEPIEEVDLKQSQIDVAVRHALEKPIGFGQNVKLKKPKCACKTSMVNEFWENESKKLAENSLKVKLQCAMPSRN